MEEEEVAVEEVAEIDQIQITKDKDLITRKKVRTMKMDSKNMTRGTGAARLRILMKILIIISTFMKQGQNTKIRKFHWKQRFLP